MINEISMPPRFRLTVRAAPMEPTRLRIAVPSSMLSISAGSAATGSCSMAANSGDSRVSGTPVSSQWANT